MSLKNSLFIKTYFLVFFLSLSLSVIIGMYHKSITKNHFENEKKLLLHETIKNLKISLIKPLRFNNIVNINNSLSPYINRTIDWAVVYDQNHIVIHTLGESPDISKIKYKILNDRNLNNSTSDLTDSINVIFIKDLEQTLGKVVFGMDFKRFKAREAEAFHDTIFLTLISFLSWVLILSLLAFYLLYKVKYLNVMIDNYEPDKLIKEKQLGYELDNIYLAFVNKTKKLYQTEKKLADQKRVQDLDIQARQVAHDIRSPLSVLNMLTSVATGLPKNQRDMLKMSVQRVNDIANNLLKKNNKSNSSIISKLQLSNVIKDVINEKCLQYKNDTKVKIFTDLNSDDLDVYANADHVELKRALSNLINNSVEALDGHGEIEVGIMNTKKESVIYVKDNGRGIHKEILSKLGGLGVTSGKEGTNSGSGLGVYGAKKSIESWGASLKFESQSGIGTVASIVFPKTTQTNQFVSP